MSSDEIVLRVDNVSKCYQIYREKHHRLLQTLLGGRKQYYREFWALRDISFDVRRGECVGIIGRNGSGKSTLLQIIAGTLTATTGETSVTGRVAALLELGSGFNPLLTGRENVYMNGLVLGLTRRQIDEKFDLIAAFADIGEFMDQPIKTYSSGMVVRLAFAVQVQVEPDILIVDEALAVGDAAFQMKCMAHMQHLMDRGTTILLVSHSVQSIRTYCSRAFWLHQGKVRESGPASDVVSQYMEFLFSGTTAGARMTKAKPAGGAAMDADKRLDLNYEGRSDPLRRWGTGEIKIERFSVAGENQRHSAIFEHLERMVVSFEGTVRQSLQAERISVAMSLRDVRGIDIIAVSSAERHIYWTDLQAGEKIEARFEFENIVNPGEYMLILAVEYFQDGKRSYSDYVENAFLIQIVSDRRHFGIVEPKMEIAAEKIRAGCPL